MINDYKIIPIGRNKELYVYITINKIPYIFKLYSDGKTFTANNLPNGLKLFKNKLLYRFDPINIHNKIYETENSSIIKFIIKEINLCGINYYQPYGIQQRNGFYYINFLETTFKPYKLRVIDENNTLSINPITNDNIPKGLILRNHILYYNNKEIKLTTNNIDGGFSYLFNIGLYVANQ